MAADPLSQTTDGWRLTEQRAASVDCDHWSYGLKQCSRQGGCECGGNHQAQLDSSLRAVIQREGITRAEAAAMLRAGMEYLSVGAAVMGEILKMEAEAAYAKRS